MSFDPLVCRNRHLDSAPLRLAFKGQRDYASWRRKVGAKLRGLLGDDPEESPLDLAVEWEHEHPDFTETRFAITVEPDCRMPCHLLIPKKGEAPFPAVICLQGHSTGMHISLGRAKFPNDEKDLSGDRDFAIQAVAEGYAALAIEQRAFGERADGRPKEVRHVDHPCHHASMTALLVGRTMVRERCWDVSRAIDALESFDRVDASRVGIMGNSGGGTISYFAGAIEKRIKIAMPSCYVCTFRDSIGRIDHCADNYVPGILKWFEMGDLACLIAPRPIVVVAGRHDDIFPFDAVQETFEKIQAIYHAAGALENCRLVVGEGGHQFYRKAWKDFRELAGW